MEKEVRDIPAQTLVWMMNWKVFESDWVFLPVRLLVRGLLPEPILNLGTCFAFHIMDPGGQPLLESAVRSGCWISLANLQSLFAALGLNKPTRGSGKRLANGSKSILKVDWARMLVQHLFPGEEDEAEIKRMIAGITHRSTKNLSDDETKILDMVSELDEENRNCPEFKKIAKLAKQQSTEKTETKARAQVFAEIREEEEARKKEEEEEKQRIEEERQKERAKIEKAALEASERERAKPSAAASSGSGTRKPSTTPKALKDFLTQAMQDDGITLNREPGSYGYRATYSRSAPGLQKNFQRKWGTSANPREEDALLTVLGFIYARWNADQKSRVNLLLGLCGELLFSVMLGIT